MALRARLLHGARFASLALVDVVALAPWGSDFFRLVRDHHDVFTQLPVTVHAAALRAYIASASYAGLTAEQAATLPVPGSARSAKRPSIARSPRPTRPLPMRSSPSTPASGSRP